MSGGVVLRMYLSEVYLVFLPTVRLV